MYIILNNELRALFFNRTLLNNCVFSGLYIKFVFYVFFTYLLCNYVLLLLSCLLLFYYMLLCHKMNLNPLNHSVSYTCHFSLTSADSPFTLTIYR